MRGDANTIVGSQQANILFRGDDRRVPVGYDGYNFHIAHRSQQILQAVEALLLASEEKYPWWPWLFLFKSLV